MACGIYVNYMFHYKYYMRTHNTSCRNNYIFFVQDYTGGATQLTQHTKNSSVYIKTSS